jgi:hypothetical protein
MGLKAVSKIIEKPEKDYINDIVAFIIDGHSNNNIIDYLKNNGIGNEKAKIIFEKALEKLLRSTKLPVGVRRGWCLEAYRHLYQKMLSSGDYIGAMKAVKEISSIAESKEPEQKKKSIKGYVNEVMTIPRATFDDILGIEHK